MARTKGHHCGRFAPPPMSRREMLLQCASGFGAVALTGLLADRTFASSLKTTTLTRRPQTATPPHHVLHTNL